jgi:hypothetical protein
MRAFFDGGGCGPVNYIDVYNLTSTLAMELREEAERMTYDGVHWGMEVNLLKAQIILHALASAATSSSSSSTTSSTTTLLS